MPYSALGNGICGVEVAANYYFNKSVEDLTLLECASIASITQNPTKYNPITRMENNKTRRNTVLDKMLELEFIDVKDYTANYNEDLELDNVVVFNDDLFTVNLSLFPQCDLIVSNPPYIMIEEISVLQKEVLFEPITALDGGKDGYDFYRCLSDRWCCKVKNNGYVAMECGENQSQFIIELFKDKYNESNVIFDFNNIDRVVTFRI